MQTELDTFKDTIWNAHKIRQQKDTVLPAGIPDHIYSFPEEYGLKECGNLWLWLFLPSFLFKMNNCFSGLHNMPWKSWNKV